MSTLIKARPNESKFYYHIMRSGFNYSFTGGTKVYIPLASAENARETSSLTGGSESLVFTVPYDGSVEKIIARSEEVCGSTEIAFHSSSLASEVPSPSPTQTVTVDMSVDDTNYNFDFAAAGTNTFTSGQIIAFGFDPTNDANDTHLTIVLKFDVTT